MLSLLSAPLSFTAPTQFVPQTAAVRSSAPQMSEPMVSRRGAAAAVAAALFAPAAANAVRESSPERARGPGRGVAALVSAPRLLSPTARGRHILFCVAACPVKLPFL